MSPHPRAINQYVTIQEKASRKIIWGFRAFLHPNPDIPADVPAVLWLRSPGTMPHLYEVTQHLACTYS